jgi:putative pyrroloquinoline-quinone binding quinoprotein
MSAYRVLLAALLAALAAGGCGGGASSADPQPASSATPSAGPSATATAAPAATARRPAAAADWNRFGYDAARTSRAPRGIAADRVAALHQRRIPVSGTVDSSPIYLAGVRVLGRTRNVIVVSTTYGRTLALDAASGRTLWGFQPSSYRDVAGSPQITTATPLSDRRWVYAASPDGRIHKLALSDGKEAGGPWPVSVTKDPAHEKIASSLNASGGRLLVTTGGYIGDAPPYQGKVVAIDEASGRITSVWNSLCSDRRRIIQPSSCGASDSAIWGRAGAVVDPANRHVYVTTSNAPFDGRTNWGDSVIELSPGAGKPLRHYTPREQAQLDSGDIDLGSTSPALLPDPGSGKVRYAVQGGKDGKLRLLALAGSLHAMTGAAGPRLGGEQQIVAAPGDTDVFSAVAVLHHRGSTVAFVATNAGTAAFRFTGSRLNPLWRNDTPGTSPVLAGGVLWVYDPTGALVAYRPQSGRPIHRFAAPTGHWNSPIVAGGRVYLPTGNANDHRTSGSLSVFAPG